MRAADAHAALPIGPRAAPLMTITLHAHPRAAAIRSCNEHHKQPLLPSAGRTRPHLHPLDLCERIQAGWQRAEVIAIQPQR